MRFAVPLWRARKERIWGAGNCSTRSVSVNVLVERIRTGSDTANLVTDICSAQPSSHLITAIRELTTLGTIGHEFWLSIAGALVIVAVFAPLTGRALYEEGLALVSLGGASKSRNLRCSFARERFHFNVFATVGYLKQHGSLNSGIWCANR